jgi:hypothetical protein
MEDQQPFALDGQLDGKGAAILRNLLGTTLGCRIAAKHCNQYIASFMDDTATGTYVVFEKVFHDRFLLEVKAIQDAVPL